MRMPSRYFRIISSAEKEDTEGHMKHKVLNLGYWYCVSSLGMLCNHTPQQPDGIECAKVWENPLWSMI